jgi:hypothetical protein
MANKKVKKNQSSRIKRDTMRTKVTEQLVVGTSGAAGTTSVSALTNSSGNFSCGYILNPTGLTSATLASGVWTAGTVGNTDPPHLRKLNNMSVDFMYYRVLGGKLNFVPNVGTTQQGVVVLASSRDAIDAGISAQVAYASSNTYKTFNLSAGKTFSIPLDVDSSWKKISSVLTLPGNSVPFTGASSQVVPCNSVNDLSFSSVMCTINGAGSVVSAGFLTVEYEVEFKGVIDSAVNA